MTCLSLQYFALARFVNVQVTRPVFVCVKSICASFVVHKIDYGCDFVYTEWHVL